MMNVRTRIANKNKTKELYEYALEREMKMLIIYVCPNVYVLECYSGLECFSSSDFFCCLPPFFEFCLKHPPFFFFRMLNIMVTTALCSLLHCFWYFFFLLLGNVCLHFRAS